MTKIKIDFLKNIAKVVEEKSNMIGNLLDHFECSAEEEDIVALVEELKYLIQVVENIPIE